MSLKMAKLVHKSREDHHCDASVSRACLAFYDVKHLKACATSAMRDAQNSQEIVETVERQTGIKINVISGDEEAVLVNENHIAENMDREHGYLYVNVGGGSTDFIFYVDGKLSYKKSIDIGTIRILKNLGHRIPLG